MNPQDLLSIHLLADLDPACLADLAPLFEERRYCAGEVILRQGEPTEALYFILAGGARVVLTDGEGLRHTLARLGPGEMFGERALLTGETRTADVAATAPLRAAVLPRRHFEEILPRFPELYARLCRHLAAQLGNWAVRHQRDEREHRETLASLVGWQLLPEFESFPGTSPWARELNRRIEGLAGGESHVLILGERGTWKDLVARLLHFHHPDPGRPVLFLDCAAPPPVLRESARPSREGQDSVLLEMAQESALFGHETDEGLYARGTRRGMVELADGGDLILRNVDSLAPRAQTLLSEFLSRGSYRRRGEKERRAARVRILATSSEPLDRMAAGGDFDPELFARLSAEPLELAPLRERKKDIPAIARRLLRSLARKHHKPARRLSPEALNLLLDHDWPLNGSELQQVLSRAVAVCDGPMLTAEQIFLQPPQLSGGRFNLLALPAVERAVRRPYFPGLLRRVTVPLFLVVILYTLFGPREENVANLAVWTLWWPALLLAAAFTSRFWCSVCPLEAIGDWAGLSRRRSADPPGWLRRFGPPLSMGGLIVILLSEQATGMFSWARTTGFFLAGLLLTTVAGDLLLGRRAWCKHLCPLGRIVSLVSRISILEMRSNPNVCASRCHTDDCIKEKACPMGLHPTGINSSDHCVLCFSCVRHCPHHSMHLDLRLPAQGILSRPRRRFSEALFAVALTGTVLAAKGGPALAGRPAEVFPTTLWSGPELSAALLLLAAYVGAALACSVGGRSRRTLATFTISGLAYLPLAFAALFATYLRAFAEGGERLLPLLAEALGLGRWIDTALLTPELGTLGLLVPLTIFAGTAFSWILLGRLNRQYALDRLGLAGHRLLFLLTGAAFAVLL